jgi:hypothetical protein
VWTYGVDNLQLVDGVATRCPGDGGARVNYSSIDGKADVGPKQPKA